MGFGNSRNRVFVQLVDGKVVEIFGKRLPPGVAGNTNITWAEWPRKDAILSIREQVWARTGGHCEFCGKLITSVTMEMHEVKPRGEGGHYSLQNSVGICYSCHQGRLDSEHGNRQLRFGER